MIRRGGRLTPSTRRTLILPIWVASLAWTWIWWLGNDAQRFWPLYVPLTLALMYEFALLPSVFLYFTFRAKAPKRRLAPKHRRVAVISLCVPSSESLNIVENQLKAMAAIKYPHDSWILDEGNSPEIKHLARRYGVKHFSRQGVERYNQPQPPFQAKTKAGNVNAWLHHVKNLGYEFFVQLDIDHLPRTAYLDKTLGYFRDPQVAWVQAPSVYKNLDAWTARGAAEQELVLQGPLQMGFYGHSQTPFIIGSHCTYRMSAVRQIGGFQPTRAEDHLDTVYLAHRGYTGVFLPEIIAEGDGPETLNTYLAQQFAWAYSMFQVLTMHTPKMVGKMPARRRLQFLFAQTWYPLWSLSFLTLFMCPVLALVADRNIVHVAPLQTLAHFGPTYACSFLVWWSARPLMQPRGLKLSWRGMILHVVRWPVIFRAIVAAAFKVKKPYMITPKGSFARNLPSLPTYRPFLLLGLLSAGSVLFVDGYYHGRVPMAQVVFALTNAAFMLGVCAVDIGLRFAQLRPRWHDLRLHWLKPVLATSALGVAMFAATAVTTEAVWQKPALGAVPTANLAVARPASYDMSTEQLIEQIRLVPRYRLPEPDLGMYNISMNLPSAKVPYVQLSFADWRDQHYVALVLAKTLQAGNVPVITLEPRGDADGISLLTAITSGSYDRKLDQLASVFGASKNVVYVRFAHEMELGNLYPWGNQDPNLYIAAYRHVADRLRADGDRNVRLVWSPAGNAGASAYYPGDNYVDVIGTTVLYDQYWFGNAAPNFSDLVTGRQWLQGYGKPVWIVEFGAGRADQAVQAQLIQQAIASYQSLGFAKLIYLNMVDANVAGPDYHLNSLNDFGQLFSN